MNEKAQRQTVVDTAREMSQCGLSPGRSGNVSLRFEGGMLITPSGIAYGDMSADDIVFVDVLGKAFGALKPSSEWQFHLATYGARPDIGGFVHSHSLNATVLACAHRPIPAFHYMVAVAGGMDIPLVDYATFGSKKLSDNVVQGLLQRDACLIANHGQCAVGKTLDRALELALEVETLSAQYVKLVELDAVHLLDDDEMGRVIELFKSYGAGAHLTDDA